MPCGHFVIHWHTVSVPKWNTARGSTAMTVQPHFPSSQAWLTDSWQRSIGAGLSECSPAEELRLTSSDLKYKHEQYQQLIDLVQSHALPLFNQLMAHSNSRLLLSDAEGYVLKHW